ncbi:MAG: sigma-70 family RNA polymerase sigma factor [Chitinophagales bacterium]|nr:sigma-70 family RNA polymerase sigma factor [Chitinophagales bacterium]
MNVVSKDNLSKQIKDKIFNEELIPQADALYNFAYSLVFEEARAQDLVQEAYLKAYRFIHSFEPGSNAKAWLFQILKNAFINEYRKKSRQPQKVDFEDYKDKNQLEKQASSIDIGQDIYTHMIGDEITGALNSLPVDFRVAIILSDIEGFTYDEVAKISDIPIGTVRSRLFRARNLMKDQLREYAKEKGFKELR